MFWQILSIKLHVKNNMFHMCDRWSRFYPKISYFKRVHHIMKYTNHYRNCDASRWQREVCTGTGALLSAAGHRFVASPLYGFRTQLYDAWLCHIISYQWRSPEFWVISNQWELLKSWAASRHRGDSIPVNTPKTSTPSSPKLSVFYLGVWGNIKNRLRTYL